MEYAKIKFESVEIAVGDNRKPEFLAINPKGQVPFITVDGVCYNESCSMLRYLAQRFSRARLYYPSDPDERFEVEKALDFYTSEFRPNMYGCVGFLFVCFM
jgi:glutathione S-transferase